MTIDEVKERYIEIIRKQNNLKGRVLSDFGEVPELYVELYGSYPECYFAGCFPDKEKTIEVIISKFNGFNPGEYIYYKDKDDKIEYDKNIYGNDILTNRGII